MRQSEAEEVGLQPGAAGVGLAVMTLTLSLTSGTPLRFPSVAGRRSAKSRAGFAVAIAVAILVHIAMLAFLGLHTGASGLATQPHGVGEGIMVALVRAPNATTSLVGTSSSQANVTQAATVGQVDAASASAEVDSADQVDLVDPQDGSPSPPSSSSGAPSSGSPSLSSSQLQPASPDPWSQASVISVASKTVLLDLWSKVAPCWKETITPIPMQLHVTLDAYGNLVSAHPATPPTNRVAVAQAMTAAMAAVTACSPYVELGNATAFDVNVPAHLRLRSSAAP